MAELGNKSAPSSSDKLVEDIFSPPGMRDREAIIQGMLRLFETPGRRLAFDRLADRDGDVKGDDDEEEKDDQQGDNTVREPNDVITSPKMSRLLSSGQQRGTDNRIGYYGPLTFLDSQTAFVNFFGDRPLMLPINPTSTGKNVVQMILREYAEKCKLDVFLHAFKDFYVGSNTKDSSAKAFANFVYILCG